ncbi:MFS transporter [Crocosphaera chwakensis]|uniref:Putative sodium:galactoside symporter protein n=1 Tax=Crocosphaera chwakensis CCY0110 TaxID=391612 RepID=A3IVR2_9CHRO|nr:MFS transporter [Crocosphaera chwakensis]EAZ89452.1 putative sodium:galactoside symporter protein [Crocosphaera chwakensis CCY0110]
MSSSQEFNPQTKLNFSTKLAYGIGELSGSLPSNILVFFFLFFLTDIAGLKPGLAGIIVMIGKIWDAINDPLIGWLSDRTRSRFGRRYPWMILGAIPLGLSCVLLWTISPSNNQTFQIIYYTIIALVFYTAFTAVLLPYSALSAELTQDYNDRTNLISFRSAFSIGGSIFALILAELIFSSVNNEQKQYLILGLMAGLISIFAIFISILGTYKRYHQVQEDYPNYRRSSSLSVKEKLRLIVTNFPFICVMIIYLCSWLSVQTIAAILPYFVINCMELTEEHFTRMAIMVQGTALLMMMVWSHLSHRLGKKIIYLMGIPFTIVAELGLFLLQPGQVTLMYIIAVMAGIGIATAYIVPWSMLPDVVDLDQLKTGERREGIFFALVVQLQKIGIAVALLMVGKILDSAGYIPGSTGQQPDTALWAIRMIIGPLPITLLFISFMFAYLYPITKEIHQDIVSKIYQKNNPGS